MGLYDIITWHTDLPELPEGQKPWLIGFQTKSLPDRCQRMFEVTLEGQLQLREFVGQGFNLTDDPVAMMQRMVERNRITNERRVSGETLDSIEYSTQSFNYSGEMVFYGTYGDPPNGRLEFYAVFQDGLLLSVHMTENRKPDQTAWDAYREACVAKGHFTVHPILDKSKESNDD